LGISSICYADEYPRAPAGADLASPQDCATYANNMSDALANFPDDASQKNSDWYYGESTPNTTGGAYFITKDGHTM
ncbi:hypothetical protein ABTN81_20155, partial [Acinetobacter baumannii]